MAKNKKNNENAPVMKSQDGRLHIDTFVNETKRGKFLNTKISNDYKDSDGEWQHNGGYSRSDLTKLHQMLGEYLKAMDEEFGETASRERITINLPKSAKKATTKTEATTEVPF